MLMRANIQAVSLKIQTLKSQNAMAQAMKGVTKAMQTMNKQMKLPEIQKIMMEFEKQTEIMDMKEEMMSDVIDDAMGDEDDEEESDAIVTQVLDELGLQLTDNLAAVPGAPIGRLKTFTFNTSRASRFTILKFQFQTYFFTSRFFSTCCQRETSSSS